MNFERRDLKHSFITSAQLPESVFDGLMALTDELLEHGGQELDYSDRLAGEIQRGQQVQIPLDRFGDDRGFPSLVEEMSRDFVGRYFSDARDAHTFRSEWPLDVEPSKLLEESRVEIYDMWVVSQLAGDYNPPHRHFAKSPCALSGVTYLKVPPGVEKGRLDGCIRFAWGQRVMFDMMNFTWPQQRVETPSPGFVLLFPAHLTHEVFPYRGEGERRSVSFNVNIWLGRIPIGKKSVKPAR